jgi:hypothetical protein
MKMHPAVLCLALSACTTIAAAQAAPTLVAMDTPTAPLYSSSIPVDPPSASAPASNPATLPLASTSAAFVPRPDHVYRPFFSYVVALRIGSGGIGGEIATPLASHFVLRGGVQAFSYSTSITTDGLTALGTLKLGDAFASIDYHPFHNGFHISPGITLHNGNSVTATINVPPGSTFTLNDVDYTSEAGDPITGSASVNLGPVVNPRVTVGWANMFPRSGGHWSFPVELGVEFLHDPTLTINLQGTACSSQGCGSIDSPENQANITAQEQKTDSDIKPLHTFPILSFGVGYRFGK